MSENNVNRRNFVSGTIAASVAIPLGLTSLEEKILAAHVSVTPAKEKNPQYEENLKKMTFGKIGNVSISRLICGGNLITGWAHSRDLLYVSSLLRTYFTEEKIMDTLELCEQNGINTIVVHPVDEAVKVLKRYWKERGGKIQWIAQVFPIDLNEMAFIEWQATKAIDDGAIGAFLEGSNADRCVQAGRIDLIDKTITTIKKKGVIAGVAGHSLRVPMDCEAAGLNPDFYVKTFHRDDYWSATPKENRVEFNVDSPSFFSNTDHNKDRDNIFCINPQETLDFMSKIDKPWIAYKVLAAGAIHPNDGFDYAFKHGADYVLAGMFDFQVAEDVKIAIQCVENNQKRTRPWIANKNQEKAKA